MKLTKTILTTLVASAAIIPTASSCKKESINQNDKEETVRPNESEECVTETYYDCPACGMG